MIQKVELKEVEIKEKFDNNGDFDGFEEVVVSKKIVPCKITNYGLKVGNDEGLLEGNVLKSILGMKKMMDLKDQGQATDEDIAASLNDTDIQKVIYIGVVGANPRLQLDFDEFTQQYHGDIEESMTIYSALIEDMYKNSSTKNAFAAGLESSTKKEKKAPKRQKSTSSA